MATEQELNEWLATEIINIDLYSREIGDVDVLFIKKENSTIGEPWVPLLNLEQAFECLETYCPDDQWWKLKVRSDGRYSLHFHIQETGWGAGWHDANTKAKAIVGAILKAENVYDNFQKVFDNDQT